MVWTEIPLDGHTELYAFDRGHTTAQYIVGEGWLIWTTG